MAITPTGMAGGQISGMAEASQQRSAAQGRPETQRNGDSFIALPGPAYHLQLLIVCGVLSQSGGGGDAAGLKVLDSPKELYPSGRLKYAVLSEEQDIGKIRLKARTHAWFREGGSIESAIVAETQHIGGCRFPKGSRVWFNEKNELIGAELSGEQEINGNIFAKGTYLWFEGGILTSARLFKEQKVDLVLLPKDTTVWFKSGGWRLESAKLRQDATVDGVRCLKEVELKFSTGESVGHLVFATLAGDQEVQGVWCAGGTEAYFYNSGDLKSAILSRGQEIEGVELAKGTKVTLDDGGRLENVTLVEAQEILGYKFKKGETVVFTYDKNGGLKVLPPD